MIEAYPLHWPVGYPRTWSYMIKSSNFSKKSLAYTTDLLQMEVKRMGGTDLIISSNIPLNKNGFPRSDYQRRIITDKGVSVYFTYKGKQVVLACDRWDSVEDNVYAISLSIQAMRGLDRWGVSEILDRTFTGFTALPEPEKQMNCWEVLDMNATRDKEAINQRYRELSKLRHPDAGGSSEAFQQLQEARDKALSFYN